MSDISRRGKLSTREGNWKCSRVLVFMCSGLGRRLVGGLQFEQPNKGVIVRAVSASLSLRGGISDEAISLNYIVIFVKGIASPLSKARNDRLYYRDN